MKILLIILIVTLAINIVSKKILMSKFINDFSGIERFKYNLNSKCYLSHIIYAFTKVLLFIELIIIAIQLVLLLF